MTEQILTGSETILLVDDDEMIIDAGGDLLEQLGYNVLAAKSGNEAIETYTERQDEIDLVILDMLMPGMGGRETFERLRQINDQVKVIISSGHSSDALIAELSEQGCNGFVQKPFRVKPFSQKIRGILDES